MFKKKFVDKVEGYIVAIDEMVSRIMQDSMIFSEGIYNCEVQPIMFGLGGFIIGVFFSENDPKYRMMKFIFRYYKQMVSQSEYANEVEYFASIMEDTYSNLKKITMHFTFLNDCPIFDLMASCIAEQFNIESNKTTIEAIRKHIELYINQCSAI
jgi:hypothetical protein